MSVVQIKFGCGALGASCRMRANAQPWPLRHNRTEAKDTFFMSRRRDGCVREAAFVDGSIVRAYDGPHYVTTPVQMPITGNAMVLSAILAVPSTARCDGLNRQIWMREETYH
ncbi:uncharacterized protein PITG_06093 [Phytophthora infestans T30-4]|uniref:Uncharacterized protein n=1 Tax=Phytophthora infestans (strain T30-4) TaxID=403677 RepID=D0N6D8_PHYIT|nr:uncharacterized protein PITG_06093 [Phytophthora infestans T30-4]EEY70629.1 hypothetical protein PITG_06093 [Phytophthora infestans T30-4]|eukprot:XP_002998283.1 hypothetical protein PITG_06093 [Phytophthora infestans T30-4]